MKRKAKRIAPNGQKPKTHFSKKVSIISAGYGYQIPPDDVAVRIFFNQKDAPDLADHFLNECKKTNWKLASGRPITNWKVLAVDLIFDYKQSKKLALRKSRFKSKIN